MAYENFLVHNKRISAVVLHFLNIFCRHQRDRDIDLLAAVSLI
jgi:hypothetical protein